MPIARYTRPAVAFHWIVAVGILANIALAWTWPYLADERVRPVINLHKSIGITVLGLAVMRWLWRLTHRPPAMPSTYQRWEVGLSHATHWLLYLLIVAMPLSGWIFDSAWKDAPQNPLMLFGLFEFPRIGFIEHLPPDTKERIHAAGENAHGLMAYAIYALFALHVAGALKHQLVDREPELQRMWFGRRSRERDQLRR